MIVYKPSFLLFHIGIDNCLCQPISPQYWTFILAYILLKVKGAEKMDKEKRQPISEVAIMILQQINSHIVKIDHMNSINEIKNEIAEMKILLDRSIEIIQLIESVNQKMEKYRK